MRRKFLQCFAAAALLLGMSACTDNNDTPVIAEEDDEVLDFPKQEIDPNEFQPIDISVALLGTLSDYAEEEAARYWFKNVQGQVTDETMVVITDEINAANEADIVKVLGRYGMLLVVDPKEENVRQYGKYFGVEHNEDYSKVKLLGLTGLGDQFVSYIGDDENVSDDPVAPAYIAGGDIEDIDPEAYLRLKAFAQWVDRIENKYTEYQNELAERQKAIDDAIAAYEAENGDEESARARLALTRQDGGNSGNSKLNISTLRGVDRSKHLWAKRNFESYDNFGRSNDTDDCHLSVTINYHFKPLYEFPKGNASGADYYVVETSVNWDCSRTLIGFKQHSHGKARARRSYLFFPIECKFYSEPLPTSSNYSVQMLAGSGGDLKPDNVKRTKTVTNIRSFNIDGNVSGGFNGERGKNDGKDANKFGGDFDASLGIGASWSKNETFTVEEYDVNKIVDGQKIGHTISVPGGEDGYRPRMVNNALDKGFEVSGGVNFAKTLHTNESWVWKVSGTRPNTNDASIKVKVVATPKVSWSSYFITHVEWGVIEHSYTMSETFEIPAPNREDVGFLAIKNTGDEDGKDGKQPAIWGVKAIDVTDPNNPVVAYEKANGVFIQFGDSFNFSLPAGKTYDIELEMGRRATKTKIYHLDRPWQVTGISKLGKTQELVTDMMFSEKK